MLGSLVLVLITLIFKPRDLQKINYSISQSKYDHWIFPPLLPLLPQPPLLTKAIVYFFSWKSPTRQPRKQEGQGVVFRGNQADLILQSHPDITFFHTSRKNRKSFFWGNHTHQFPNTRGKGSPFFGITGR